MQPMFWNLDKCLGTYYINAILASNGIGFSFVYVGILHATRTNAENARASSEQNMN